MKVIAFLARYYDMNIAKFAKCLMSDEYKIYMFVDSPIDDIRDKIIPGINVIYYTDETAKYHHYTNGLLSFTKNGPTSWDKALYHFCKVETHYDYVWFVEDDCFITNESVIRDMDYKFPVSDLLCNQNKIITSQKDKKNSKWPHWEHAKNIDFPYSISMVCCCRLSKRLLNIVRDYVVKYNELMFHEIMFNTLCLHNNLRIDTPVEIRNILYRYDWTADNMKDGYIYHPVKDTKSHDILRDKINKK